MRDKTEVTSKSGPTSKVRLIGTNCALFFWEGFYLTCSNKSCLADGNSYELMMALFIALGSGVVGIGFGLAISTFLESRMIQVADERIAADRNGGVDTVIRMN